MQNISKGQKTVAAEISFFRNIDVSAADFDGTDTASLASTMLTPEGYNRFTEGFYFQPDTDGDVECLSYEDWWRNNKVVDDSYRQILPACAAGIFHPTRVVKIYTALTVPGTLAIGV